MWICPLCGRGFENANQRHSCREKELANFLDGKSQHTLALFDRFVEEYQKIGDVKLHPLKSMIAIAAPNRFAYIIQLGKAFVDVVFPFKQPFEDNLCFNKIKQVPGTDDYNHHLRLYFAEDINDEVIKFMKLAYQTAADR